jgi:type VI secretion system protein ImpM
MRLGLFGKLQAKRDFIAIATPRSFLAAWEPWLQAGVSASRMQLGERWRDAFLTAPIWRFWLGAEICGTTAVGAIMPSMDGVGRYFPLTVATFAEAGDAPAPPEIDAYDDWFVSLEDFLFTTLDPTRSFEQTTEAMERLPRLPAPVLHPSKADLATHSSIFAGGDEDFSTRFWRTRTTNYLESYAAMTFWWTVGGKDYEPAAIASLRMPDPALFARMLAGDFSDAGAATVATS